MSLSIPIFGLAAYMFESPLIFPQLSDSWWGIVYMGLAVNAISFVGRAELFVHYNVNSEKVMPSYALAGTIIIRYLSDIELKAIASLREELTPILTAHKEFEELLEK